MGRPLRPVLITYTTTMKKIKLVLQIAAVLILQACSKNGQTPVNQAETEIVAGNALDSVSYAIGQNVARILKGQGFDTLNYTVFTAAIESSMNGEQLWFDPAEANRYINLYVIDQVRELSSRNLAFANTWLDSIAHLQGVREVSKGVYMRITKEGNGKLPAATDEVEINFHGELPDGEVFDDSFARNSSVTFVVNSAIDGWQAVLPLLQEGAEAEIWLHPDMGYGTQGGYFGVIPANSALYYKMEFIRIVPGGGY